MMAISRTPESFENVVINPKYVALVVRKYLNDNKFIKTRNIFKYEASSLVPASPIPLGTDNLWSLSEIIHEYICLSKQKLKVCQERDLMEQERNLFYAGKNPKNSAMASTIPDQRRKIEMCKYYLSASIWSKNIDVARVFIERILADYIPLEVSQELLQSFTQELGRFEPKTQKEIALSTLTQIGAQDVFFLGQVIAIRDKLCKLYESEGQFSEAAQILSGVDLDSGRRDIDDTFRYSTCIRIANLYLQNEDADNADPFIYKASLFVSKNQPEILNLNYKICYAKLLDLKRKFLEAALQYYEISQIEKRQIEDSYHIHRYNREIKENLLPDALSAAVTCAILADAGPQRSRVLATLYKDERCSKLKIYPILQKVHLKRILLKPEIDAFAEELKPHQKASLLPDNSTVC